MKSPRPIVNLAELPVFLTLADMAGIYRVSESTIRRGLANGTFHPRPARRAPYRWKKADVMADLDRPTVEPPQRLGRLTPARASLTRTVKTHAI